MCHTSHMEGLTPENSSWDLNQQEVARLADAEYQRGTDPFYMRWEPYEFSELPGYGMYEYYIRAYDELRCSQDATILDVGGNDGHGLLGIKLLRRHSGPAIVLDNKQINFDTARYLNRDLMRSKLAPLAFTLATAESLPFEDNSIDAAMAMFTLYHIPRPELALQELVRVTKPGSKIAIATSGPYNKIRQREFEASIADYLGIQAPQVFSRNFNTLQARDLLPKYFKVTTPLPRWRSTMKVPYVLNVDRSGLRKDDSRQIIQYGAVIYLRSLESMRVHFSPEPDDDAWQAALQAVVWPKINEAMDRQGFFEDEIDREFYICENTKGT